MGGETSASEQIGVMQWTGTLLRNVACFRLRSGLAIWFVPELWRLDFFSCTSSSFLCAGTLSPRGKFSYFFAGGLVGVDKHLFQRVSLITSMSLPLNYIFVLLFTNVDVIPKQKQLSTV